MAKAKDGWYILPRSIAESPVWECGDPFGKRSAYVDLCLMANYEDKKLMPKHNNSAITIHEGELLTSYDHLALRWKWSKNKVIAYLKQLESCDMITRKTYSFGTVISIAQYGKSGVKQTENRYASETANETESRTQSATQRGTSVGTASATASATAEGLRHKEIKEVKESKRNGKEKKEIKESAKRSGGFVWEGDPE